jgi:Zinc-binding loop region of homing endonuclease
MFRYSNIRYSNFLFSFIHSFFHPSSFLIMSDYVTQQLQSLVLVLSTIDNSDLIGEITSGKIRMPIEDDDKRVLTWSKLVRQIGKKIINHPQTDKDCWFVASNTNRYHHTKISKSGSNNKKLTHRLLFVLAHPSKLDELEDDNKNTKRVCAHRCGRGRQCRSGLPICINPFHLVLVSQKLNNDHKGCKYGCRALCPHEPKCIFTWHDDGTPKPCFNAPVLTKCSCERTCSHTEEIEE